MTNYSSSSSPARSAFAERLAYPQNALVRRLARSPIFFWRLGYGPVLGRIFLILTHIGRRSGKVRRTALEYHTVDGRIYVFNAWPRSDWIHNILAEPRVTVQTAHESMSALARPLTTQHDYLEAYALVERSLIVRGALKAMGIDTSLEGFLAAKDQMQIVTFDPTDLPAPPPLRADLRWLSPVVAAALGLGFIAGKLARKKKKGFWQRLSG